jgi:eukaryotic-like serine/threonine-protein kinase
MSSTPERLTAALADRYRVLRELGAGGMATVYLAEDLKHRRNVAVKVLKPELSAVIGAERFLVEIRTTANLQHPHILPLFDSGEVDGTVYYVMPFVEGESLRDRISREKQLSIEDALHIASEVASALDYAHRQGVIHRDIKPENILLHDGRALVADFGIALAASRTEGGSRLTETGMSLGTPHYMSPEQALGERNLDARTDVYALGCVLHEMLCGEPPFTGPTAQAVMARVLSGEPEPVTALRRTVPPHVADAILAALAKLPADRFATAAAFAAALADPAAAGTYRRPTSGATPAAQRGGRSRLSAVGWPLLSAAAVAMAAWGWWRPTPAPVPTRLLLSVPTVGGSGTFLQRVLDITPDGRSLVYLESSRDGQERLVLRHLDEDESTLLAHVPADFSAPTFAPDGRSFVASNLLTGQLVRFPVEGGRGDPFPRELANTVSSAWGEDGSLWVSPLSGLQGALRVSSTGDVSAPFSEQNGFLTVQQVLPGNRHGLAVRAPIGTSFGQAFVIDLRSGEREPILGSDIVELRHTDGVLVYVVGSGELLAVRWDQRTRRPVGNAVQLASDVSLTGGGGANLAVSRNGTLVFVPEAPRSLVLINRDGSATPAVQEGRTYHIPRFSPDGRYLLADFNSLDGRDVWRIELATSTLSRMTFDRDGHDAAWEPDGRHIAYISAARVPGTVTILRTAAGQGSPDSLISSTSIGYTGVWMPDRSAIITAGNSLRTNSQGDIAIIRNGGRGPIEPVVATQFDESFPAVSPDGRWLAYTSNQTGAVEVYVRPLGRDGDELRVSLTGGTEPAWAPDGRELFYRGQTGSRVMLVSAALGLGASPSVLSRSELFDVTEMASSSPHTNYDVSPDGRRFAMVRRNPSGRIVVIQHLPELVARLERRR